MRDTREGKRMGAAANAGAIEVTTKHVRAWGLSLAMAVLVLISTTAHFSNVSSSFNMRSSTEQSKCS